MRLYERLYIGDKAKKNRFSILQSLRAEKTSGYYVLTPASNPKNLLDIYSAASWNQSYFKQQDPWIIGIAADHEDAAALVGKIVGEVYRKTGGYDVGGFLKQEIAKQQE